MPTFFISIILLFTGMTLCIGGAVILKKAIGETNKGNSIILSLLSAIVGGIIIGATIFSNI